MSATCDLWLSVLRVAAQQFQRMRQQINDCFQRFDRACRISREVQDHHFTPGAARSPAQGGKWSFLPAFETHAFRHAFQEALADSPRCLWSYIARRNARAARRYYQPGILAELHKGVLNVNLFIGDDLPGHNLEPAFFERLGHRRSGEVISFGT